MFIVGLWNAFNLVMAGVALGAVSERKEPRRHPRLNIARKGALAVGGEKIAVDIVNVSAGGCALRLNGDMPAALLKAQDIRARLTIEPIGDLVGDRTLPLIFRRAPDEGGEKVYGCQFETLQPEEYFVLADLMYGDPDALPQFLASRRKHKSLWAGTAQFLWWGVIEPLRALSYLFIGRPPEEQALESDPKPATVWLRRLSAQAGTGAPPAVSPSSPAEPQQPAAQQQSA